MFEKVHLVTQHLLLHAPFAEAVGVDLAAECERLHGHGLQAAACEGGSDAGDETGLSLEAICASSKCRLLRTFLPEALTARQTVLVTTAFDSVCAILCALCVHCDVPHTCLTTAMTPEQQWEAVAAFQTDSASRVTKLSGAASTGFNLDRADSEPPNRRARVLVATKAALVQAPALPGITLVWHHDAALDPDVDARIEARLTAPSRKHPVQVRFVCL